MTKYNMTVRAGVGSEKGKDEPFRYITSEIPKGVRSIDEEPYGAMCEIALNTAKEIVLRTGKDITLKLKIESLEFGRSEDELTR